MCGLSFQPFINVCRLLFVVFKTLRRSSWMHEQMIISRCRSGMYRIVYIIFHTHFPEISWGRAAMCNPVRQNRALWRNNTLRAQVTTFLYWVHLNIGCGMPFHNLLQNCRHLFLGNKVCKRAKWLDEPVWTHSRIDFLSHNCRSI